MDSEGFDIERGLHQVFHKASMHHALGNLRRPEDFAQANEIITTGEKEREALQKAYERDFETRVDKARQRLIDEAGSKTHDHPTPFGVDRFSDANITKRARNEVIRTHQGDLLRLEEAQQSEMDALIANARTRDQHQGEAQHAFNHATDRRHFNRSR